LLVFDDLFIKKAVTTRFVAVIYPGSGLSSSDPSRMPVAPHRFQSANVAHAVWYFDALAERRAEG
jgi:hypothetical protein